MNDTSYISCFVLAVLVFWIAFALKSFPSAVRMLAPISVSPPADGHAQVTFDSPKACTIHWPISFEFNESINEPTRSGGTSRTYGVTIIPYDPYGVFSWNAPCTCGCLTCSGSSITFGCTSECTCGGSCTATGSYGYEGLSFPVTGGECRCEFNDTERPAMPQSEGPCVSMAFSDSAVIFEDSYQESSGVWKPKRSTRTWLTAYANGGPNGGTLSFASQNLEKLVPVACGPVVLPLSINLAPNETFSAQFLFEGELPSAATNDIAVTGSLLPAGASEPIQTSAMLTCVRLLLTPQVAVGNCANRHIWGIGESIVCSWQPSIASFGITDLRGGVVIGNGATYRVYQCPFHETANVVSFGNADLSYYPLCSVVMPETVFVGRAFEEQSLVAPGDAGGVEMHLELFIAPTNVSFMGLSFMEVPSSQSVVTGYFQNIVFSDIWYHDEDMGAGVWHPVRIDNFFFDDYPRMNEMLPQPWSAGVLRWTIPIGWCPKGATSVTNALDSVVFQQFDFTNSGRLRVTKLGKWVERDPDGSTRCSQGVEPL